MSVHICEDEIIAYANDGEVLIKNLLSTDEVAVLRAGIDGNISNPGSRSKVASYEKDPVWFLEDVCSWQDNPAYQTIIFESQISEWQQN